jgi:rare lipoprotein A
MFEIVALMLISQQPMMPVVEGVASYYTVASSGTRTASGEPMSDEVLACAMRVGDFGAQYLVVGENGRSVVCRLNDRGPYKRGRVIDLSKAAMKELTGGGGKLRVKVYRLGQAPPAG